MLIACQSCHRQYDVGDLASGSKVRCACGELCRVPEPAPREARMQHCSNCGAAIAEGIRQCSYCSAEIQLGDRGFGETCPECMARMIKDARYCSSCGTHISVEGIVRAMASRNCPRCEGQLAECENGTMRYVECTACGGIWLTEKSFEGFTQRHESDAYAALIPSRLQAELPPRAPEAPVKYLKCPECTNLMHRKNFAGISGIVIDWCRGHGYWFDAHELEHIHNFLMEGGMDRARERRIMDQTRQIVRKQMKNEKDRRERHSSALTHRVERGGPGTNLIEILGYVFLGGLFD